MNFNTHSEIDGKHAFLSPSSYHWVNYTDQKLVAKFYSYRAADRGTALHRIAQQCITHKIKLSKSYPTMSMYVADAIAYQMEVEQPLFYSINCFGTVDAISFRRNKLRIHDLKTGITPASFKQLEVYTAIFCLEYNHSPFDLDIELRIYQNDSVEKHIPEPEVILEIMDRIIDFDTKLELLKDGEEL